MKEVIRAVNLFVVSLVGVYLVYAAAGVYLSLHHLFGFLTVVGFIALVISGAIIRESGRLKDFHLYTGVLTAVAMIATLLFPPLPA